MTKAKSQFACGPRVIRALRARHSYKLAPRELCMEQTSFITSKCETQSSKKIRSESKCRIPHALHKVAKREQEKPLLSWS